MWPVAPPTDGWCRHTSHSLQRHRGCKKGNVLGKHRTGTTHCSGCWTGVPQANYSIVSSTDQPAARQRKHNVHTVCVSCQHTHAGARAHVPQPHCLVPRRGPRPTRQPTVSQHRRQVCPVSVATQARVCMSHRRTVLSYDPLARLPSGRVVSERRGLCALPAALSQRPRQHPCHAITAPSSEAAATQRHQRNRAAGPAAEWNGAVAHRRCGTHVHWSFMFPPITRRRPSGSAASMHKDLWHVVTTAVGSPPRATSHTRTLPIPSPPASWYTRRCARIIWRGTKYR